jgi:hypothetical protein
LEIWVIYPPENEGNPSNHSSSPSISTSIGHSENPDEATLVQQHTDQFGFQRRYSQSEVGHGWQRVNHQREWEHGGGAHD